MDSKGHLALKMAQDKENDLIFNVSYPFVLEKVAKYTNCSTFSCLQLLKVVVKMPTQTQKWFIVC